MGTGVSSSVGGVGTINAAELGALGRPTMLGFVEDCAPSAGGGTRQVTVASGRVWVANSYHNVSGATLSLAENTSGQSRIDIVALYFTWSGDASLVVVQGTPSASPAAPVASLATTAGSAWHVPICQVTVASGAGVLTSAAVRDVRPGPWVPFSPLSPWSDYGGSYEVCASRILPGGDVELRGMVLTTSTITSPTSQPIVTFPAGMRPAKTSLHAVIARDGSMGSASPARIDIASTGQLTVSNPQTTTGTRWYSLSGIRWTPTT